MWEYVRYCKIAMYFQSINSLTDISSVNVTNTFINIRWLADNTTYMTFAMFTIDPSHLSCLFYFVYDKIILDFPIISITLPHKTSLTLLSETPNDHVIDILQSAMLPSRN